MSSVCIAVCGTAHALMPEDPAAGFSIFSAGIISGSGTPCRLRLLCLKCGRGKSPNPNFMLQSVYRFGSGGFAKGALNLGAHSILGHFFCQFGWVEAPASARK